MLWNVITARQARAALALTLALASGAALAQSAAPAPADPPSPISPRVAGPWSILPALPDAVAAAPAWIRPARAQWLALDDAAMRAVLAAAPLEGTPAANAPIVLTLPDPTGRLQRFAIVESPVMEPALAAQFPQIRTYAGKGLDDRAATIRLDLTPQGFHAQVLSPRRDADDADPRAGDLWPAGPGWPGGTWYIDPVSRNDWIHHASYFKRDLPNRHRAEWTCSVEAEPDDLEQIQGEVGISRAGPTLRTYRLAAACTGEYAAFHGGTVASAQAAIVTAINRVNQIYEVEFAIRLVLVANNTAIVFTDAASDPFTNGVPNTLIGESQTTINNLIGSANYDIGHTLNTGGGGLAGLGVVCRSTQKARGVTGLSSPTGDPFVIDYLCHEIGHQFGASHTFNSSLGSCASNRSGNSAYEPGSGSTIMAYTGICAEDDLQRDADPMFHSRSFDQVLTYTTTGQGANCDATSATGNTAPSVSAGAARTIPSQTPFTLTATASDAEGDALSFSWEQRDLGPAATLNTVDDGLIPLVRTRAPVTTPIRIVPRLSTIIAGTTNNQERLPQVSRTMRWRVTARDNRAGGGGLNTSDVSLSVVGAAGPFRITFPSGPVSWPATSTQTISWDVAGTTANGINTAAVNILLSTDGGNTFPHTLAANTPNDGSEPVTIPDLLSSNARIKVEPVGNIYFAMSGGPITITSAPPPPPTNLTASPNPACPGQSVTFTADAAPGLQIQWFSASCGSGFIAFGPSATLVMPEGGLTVFCRARDTAAGVSSACASISVDPGSARPADFNGDGNTDPDDLSDFIACYFDPACPQADFNHDGSRDPDDLSDFIAAFFAGNAGGC